MKKNIILLVFFILSISVSTSWTADVCVITWQGDYYTGQVSTTETTRTPQAAEELFDAAMSGSFGCCSESGTWLSSGCYGYECVNYYCSSYVSVCPDGTWFVGYADKYCSPFPDVFCEYISGTWDVVCSTDTDGDGILDALDNCPSDSNPAQEDCDGNGVGDACEVGCGTDSDTDGVLDCCDNCPSVSNPAQEDCDGNSVGDVCEVDGDTDGIPDSCDNCPANSNPSQEDCDGNGTGDVCDVDSDSDGFSDGCDNCPTIFNPHQYDTDGDGEGDECDDDVPPVIFDVETNQGPSYEYIPLVNWMVFSVPQEMIVWSATDPNALPEQGDEWTWTYGLARSLFSYRVVGETSWSEEIEMPFENPSAGYYGQWKWISLVALIPEDGFYDIKLISEDVAGNRAELIYYITIDKTDSDGDSIPDDVDICPDTCNSEQLDADEDDIGDVCDETPGCGGCGQTACEQECMSVP